MESHGLPKKFLNGITEDIDFDIVLDEQLGVTQQIDKALVV